MLTTNYSQYKLFFIKLCLGIFVGVLAVFVYSNATRAFAALEGCECIPMSGGCWCVHEDYWRATPCDEATTPASCPTCVIEEEHDVTASANKTTIFYCEQLSCTLDDGVYARRCDNHNSFTYRELNYKETDACNGLPVGDGGWHYIAAQPCECSAYQLDWLQGSNLVGWQMGPAPQSSCPTEEPAPTCTSVDVGLACTAETSGTVYAYAYGVTDATSVTFPTWSEENGPDDLVAYSGTAMGSGTWRAGIDLSNHPGLGNILTEVYMHNADHTDVLCGDTAFNHVAMPGCASDLSVNVQCSDFANGATFSWIETPGAYRYILRIDYDDNEDPEWFSTNDRYHIVPDDLGYCDGTTCTVTLTDFSSPPFLQGTYNSWSVQSVDACGDGHCQAQADGFVCEPPASQPPVCTAVTGELSVTEGAVATYTVAATDPESDPMSTSWTATCGTFPNGASSSTLSNNWQAPVGFSGTCTLTATVNDGTSNGNSCSIDITVSPNSAPVCTSISGVPWLAGGSTSTYTVAATDLEGDAISTTWSATCGTFPNGNVSPTLSNVWQAPLNTTATCTLSAVVTDVLSSGNTCTTDVAVYTTVDLSGYIFETNGSVGSECPENNPAAKSLESELSPGAQVTLHSMMSFGSVDIIGGMYSAAQNSGTVLTAICLDGDLDAPADQMYVPVCTKGAVFNPSGAGCFSGNLPLTADTSLHLGFGLVSAFDGWFTSIDGDVYSGGDISMTVPETPALGSIGGYLIDALDFGGFAFSGSTVAVSGGGEDRIFVDGSGGVVEDIEGGLPLGLTFEIPVGAIEVDDAADFGSLDPTEVYRISSSNLNNILQSDFTYDLSTEGVAVVYVDGNISFEANLTASDENERILFVTAGSVSFGSDIGDTVPAATSPHIEAFVLASGVITFETADPTADSSIVIDGSIVSATGINFERDRIASNDYPAEIIRYDHNYLYNLTQQERASGVMTYTGLAVVDVEWGVEDE